MYFFLECCSDSSTFLWVLVFQNFSLFKHYFSLLFFRIPSVVLWHCLPPQYIFYLLAFLRKGKQDEVEFAATRLSWWSAHIAVGTSVNTDTIKTNYNLYIIMLSLFMKVNNIRVTFPSTVRLHKNETINLERDNFSKACCNTLFWWGGVVRRMDEGRCLDCSPKNEFYAKEFIYGELRGLFLASGFISQQSILQFFYILICLNTVLHLPLLLWSLWFFYVKHLILIFQNEPTVFRPKNWVRWCF